MSIPEKANKEDKKTLKIILGLMAVIAIILAFTSISHFLSFVMGALAVYFAYSYF